MEAPRSTVHLASSYSGQHTTATSITIHMMYTDDSLLTSVFWQDTWAAGTGRALWLVLDTDTNSSQQLQGAHYW